MAIGVVIETRIGRPADEVFRHLADLERWPEWLIATGVRHVRRTGTGSPARGEALVIDQAAAGRAATFDARVDDAEPPTRLRISGRDHDGITIDFDASLAAAEPTVTILRWSIRIGVPLRYRIFETLARPQVERAAALDVEAFKRRLESVATD